VAEEVTGSIWRMRARQGDVEVAESLTLRQVAVNLSRGSDSLN
jgi:hypothetical protein